MLKARSDLRGYIPGQVIKLATEIHNKSGKDTGYVLASLIQVAAWLCPLFFFLIHSFEEWGDLISYCDFIAPVLQILWIPEKACFRSPFRLF